MSGFEADLRGDKGIGEKGNKFITELKSKELQHTSIKNIKALIAFNLIALFPSKRAAFTLAEVLITLGVIGIVAAMTLPTLIGKYKEKQTVTAVKTAYSIFSQAFYQMANDNAGLINIFDVNATAQENSLRVFNELEKYLKQMKKCDNTTKCMGGIRYKTFTGVDSEIWDRDGNNVIAGILSNGMTFWALGGLRSDGKASVQIGVDKMGIKVQIK